MLQPHSVVITDAEPLALGAVLVLRHHEAARSTRSSCTRSRRTPVEVPGRLGVLATRGDTNYYHFLHDVLPRVAVLEQAGVERPDRWYVPHTTRFQRELLELWGIGEDADRRQRRGTATSGPRPWWCPGLASTIERNPPWVSQLLRDPAGARRGRTGCRAATSTCPARPG